MAAAARSSRRLSALCGRRGSDAEVARLWNVERVCPTRLGVLPSRVCLGVSGAAVSVLRGGQRSAEPLRGCRQVCPVRRLDLPRWLLVGSCGTAHRQQRFVAGYDSDARWGVMLDSPTCDVSFGWLGDLSSGRVSCARFVVSVGSRLPRPDLLCGEPIWTDTRACWARWARGDTS